MKSSVLIALMIAINTNTVCAVRDPFIRMDGFCRYIYSAFGTIHNTKSYFALLSIDGLSYQVKVGDVVAGHLILIITESEIVLKDPQGHEKKIFLQKKALQLR